MSFYTSIAENYAHIFPFNPAQCSFIAAHSDVSSLSSMLEIGSATGILTAACRQQGYPIQGLELDPQMVRIAQENYPDITFTQGNMLNVDHLYDALSFDVLVCFGNTIVHLTDLKEIAQFLAKAYAVLAPEGRLLVQFINYDRIIDNAIRALPTIENQQITFVRNYNLISHQALDFNTKLSLHATKEEICNTQRLFPLRKRDFEALAADIGFRTQAYGSFAGSAWSEDAMQSIFVCCK